MEMVKMLKIRIYPDEKDKSLLIDSMHAYVAGCNYVSEYVYTSENLSAVSVQKEIIRSAKLSHFPHRWHATLYVGSQAHTKLSGKTVMSGPNAGSGHL